MKSFPVLETERLQLRRPLASDIADIVKYAGHPQIAAMTLNIPHPYREKDAIAWLDMVNEGFEKDTRYAFAVNVLPDSIFMGCMGLEINTRFNRAELGYWIAEPYWNRGYASEATKAILKFGFEETGLNKIYASHYEKNPASGKVMIKNGMIKEGELKEHVKKDDQYLSIVQYRLTKKEFEDLNNHR